MHWFVSRKVQGIPELKSFTCLSLFRSLIELKLCLLYRGIAALFCCQHCRANAHGSSGNKQPTQRWCLIVYDVVTLPLLRGLTLPGFSCCSNELQFICLLKMKCHHFQEVCELRYRNGSGMLESDTRLELCEFVFKNAPRTRLTKRWDGSLYLKHVRRYLLLRIYSRVFLQVLRLFASSGCALIHLLIGLG